MRMKVVFIGSGNVATHLALNLQSKGVIICQIYSRTAANAEALATKIGTSFTSDISKLERNADIYIYALKDNSFQEILHQIDLPHALHVHTAGSLPMNSFEGYAQKYGVFYPLQTFSINRQVDFAQIPICIEANSPETEKILLDLAHLLTQKTYIINSEQRIKLHLAAVFACNFTNYMYDIAAQLIDKEIFGFDILQALIVETADKVMTMTPRKAQTGPAVRFDKNIIEKHLSLLDKTPAFKSIYQELSENIYQTHIEK
jgi:predicted short-subunit dehydrogenase-like oxidoreductase (DUF2520 family)